MESRSEHSPPEQQTWNTQYFTPQTPGAPAQTEAARRDVSAPLGTANTALCAQVREQLQGLLENDGTVRPETATALYVHLAVCAECAREFQSMQRVVQMLESLPLAELPSDYSRLVMRRIQSRDVDAVQSVSLCDRVREKLQPLLENDPGIQPEMISALYGHLAVCPECASEFAGIRRVVNLLETLPAVELPIDYSPQIMARVLSAGSVAAPPLEVRAPGPTFAASSLVSEGVATRETRRLAESVSLGRIVTTGLTAAQRLIAAVALSGMFVYLLASDWGRQALGVNVEAAGAWLSQVGEHLQQAPVLGPLIVSLSAALASMNDAISHTFAALGGMAAQTLVIEVSLALAAWLVISNRRNMRISGA
jgi:anti-sigma factor RsiW